MTTVIGKEGISAKILKHSWANQRDLITFEIEYPRFIHSELMTHRMLSKNCASSRAIPVKKMLDLIRENPAMPVWWGKNQPGMQAAEELADPADVKKEWVNTAGYAASVAEYLDQLGLHKQITNRITEPWQRMKTVISGTEWNNFFALRDHKDAQPEFRELARCMNEAVTQSIATVLSPGEWHLPYIVTKFSENGEISYWVDDTQVDVETAKIVSTSCCAQVSYRSMNEDIDTAKRIFKRLNLDKDATQPPHFSPAEHQATPMRYGTLINAYNPNMWEAGVTHVGNDSKLWSGNFSGWVQHRQLIMHDNNVVCLG